MLRASFAALIVAAIVSSLTSDARGQERFDLERAIRLAEERNKGVRAAQAGVDAAEARRAVADILVPHNPTVEAAIGPRTRQGTSRRSRS